MRKLVDGVLDVFMPRCCVHCGGGVEDVKYDFICSVCAREIFLCSPPACRVCGYPFFGVLAGPQACPHCCELEPAFDEGKTLFLAKGPGRSLIHTLKYEAGFYLLKDLKTMILGSPHFQDYVSDSILIPVPLHPVKLRERGFNQSERIAETLAAVSAGSSAVEKLLSRVAFTRTQTKLNREQRQQNVKNAFALAPNAVLLPYRQYILVDDVFTTGATLNACASVLRRAGVRHLKVLTMGHG